ncbi:type II secretion system protein, partial [bacterium]|nr:type II secretion system protein [bacterium]
MKMKKRGFTLVEVMIATGIMGVLIIAIFYYLRGNLNMYKKGSSKISFQTEVQRVMKVLYIELKKVNPSIYMDSDLNVVLDDEYRDDLKLTPVELYDLDNNINNGFERINLWEHKLRRFSEKKRNSFYVKKGKGLFKESFNSETDVIHKKLISSYVTDIKFFRNKYDNNVIRV